MNLGDPVAERTLAVTLVTVDKEVTPLTCEGEVGKYGRVFGTHHLRPSDASRETYKLDGTAKTLLEDGTMLTSSLREVGRRSGGAIKLFSLDNVRNGDQNLAVLETRSKRSYC